jgi:hypothetical protein
MASDVFIRSGSVTKQFQRQYALNLKTFRSLQAEYSMARPFTLVFPTSGKLEFKTQFEGKLIAKLKLYPLKILETNSLLWLLFRY